MISDLDYEWIKFERQKNIWINMFCDENGLTYPGYVSNQKFRDCMDLLLMSGENKSCYVYIKDFNRFMFNKTKKIYKNIFTNAV